MSRSLIACCFSGTLFVTLAATKEPKPKPAFQMTIVSGDWGVNSTTAKGNVVAPLVRLRTATGAPASGVPVRFELIGQRSRGSFGDNQSVLNTVTNARGEAVASGYIPQGTGSFLIRVTSGKAPAVVTAEIHQRNHNKRFSVYSDHRSPKAPWIILGVGTLDLILVLALR